jgi:hypothetical protein
MERTYGASRPLVLEAAFDLMRKEGKAMHRKLTFIALDENLTKLGIEVLDSTKSRAEIDLVCTQFLDSVEDMLLLNLVSAGVVDGKWMAN